MATHFIVNDRLVDSDAPELLLVLDWLRKHEGLSGTKEGCKEGDCGACMVLVGRLQGGRVAYTPMTSCLMPLGELHGAHVVTVEGLNMDTLSPVQAAIVELGATQCGYCTPGFVISLTGLLLDATRGLSAHDIKYALGGNLCRCTGYRSLKAAGASLKDTFGGSLNGDRMSMLLAAKALPDYFADIPERLAAIPAPLPTDPGGETLKVSGGTDLYVQHGDDLPHDAVVLRRDDAQDTITCVDGMFRLGALTTFEAFGRHPEIQACIPGLGDYLILMASWQIRNRATLVGNLVNASPIADMTPLMLVLETQLVLRGPSGERSVPLSEFYLGYKQIDLKKDEHVTEICFPRPAPGTVFNWEKLSKRETLDIATANSGFRIRCDQDRIVDVCLSMGGVAATPLIVDAVREVLVGEVLSEACVMAVVDVVQNAISPIDDVRGSAAYRRLLAQQFILAHFIECFPDRFSFDSFLAPVTP